MFHYRTTNKLNTHMYILKKKKSLPTDPLFFQPATGNKHIFFLALYICITFNEINCFTFPLMYPS